MRSVGMNYRRNSMGLTIVGTVAFDNLTTPFGSKMGILGGSATHAAMAARFFCPVSLVSVVGDDFSPEIMQDIQNAGIRTAGVQVKKGFKTFSWTGAYEYDMSQARTIKTELDILNVFEPQIPVDQSDQDFVFLANLDPELQLKALAQIKVPRFVALDSMNLWIQSKKEVLLKVIAKANLLVLNEAEIRQLTQETNLLKAARRVHDLGPTWVLIKRGEHGATLYSKQSFFSVPAYPLEEVFDPTGAGDALAGGFIGYLANTQEFSEINLRRATVVGSCMASFIVEAFGCERLQGLTIDEIEDRFQEFISFARVDMPVPVWDRRMVSVS